MAKRVRRESYTRATHMTQDSCESKSSCCSLAVFGKSRADNSSARRVFLVEYTQQLQHSSDFTNREEPTTQQSSYVADLDDSSKFADGGDRMSQILANFFLMESSQQLERSSKICRWSRADNPMSRGSQFSIRSL